MTVGSTDLTTSEITTSGIASKSMLSCLSYAARSYISGGAAIERRSCLNMRMRLQSEVRCRFTSQGCFVLGPKAPRIYLVALRIPANRFYALLLGRVDPCPCYFPPAPSLSGSRRPMCGALADDLLPRPKVAPPLSRGAYRLAVPRGAMG